MTTQAQHNALIQAVVKDMPSAVLFTAPEGILCVGHEVLMAADPEESPEEPCENYGYMIVMLPTTSQTVVELVLCSKHLALLFFDAPSIQVREEKR